MMTSSSNSSMVWTVLNYEVGMFLGVREHLIQKEWDCLLVKNALAESLLIHTRTLADIIQFDDCRGISQTGRI